MISQEVDLVAGEFNGTAWRCRSRDNLSTIDEAFADCALSTPLGPTPLWGPGSVPNNWADVCVFLKPPGSQRFWEGTKHSAFSIPQNALETNDQTCLIHISSIGTANGPNQAYYNGNISLKERPAGSTYGTQKTKISEVMSDHSLSS